MGVWRAVFVTCDGCGEDSDHFDHDARASRSVARDTFGWKVGLPGGKDYCPKCAAATEEADQ